MDTRIDRLEEALSHLVEVQARTTEQVGRLGVQMERVEAALVGLAEAQARTEERVGRLEEALSRLAEAQARTEERVGRLEEAQARTEERMGRLEEALRRLAEAQARTEERMGHLEEALRRLAEAQARTEERVSRLEEVVAELVEGQRRLAEAQARTEVALQALAQQVARLGDTIGFTLEDLAREVTPAYLAHHYGIQVSQLDRHFVVIDEQELEVDFYGEGRRNGELVTIVGEVRSRIYGRDVEEAVRRATRIAPQLRGTPVIVLFGFVIHPSAREAANRMGAIVISSSGR